MGVRPVKATLFKKVDYSVQKLVDDIEAGEIGLPDIQRPFVWKATKVRDLFDSMYRGYPVGYLLFWANLGAETGKQIGTDGKQQDVAKLLIVDGQQRLTSLYAVIYGVAVVDENYENRRIRVAFRPRDERFEVTDAAIEKDPEWVPDISLLWSKETTLRKSTAAFMQRLRESREVTEDEQDQLEEHIDHVVHDVRHYPFTALELVASLDEEQVAEVFVRINSKGETLNQADFILTLMSVFWDKGRKQLEQFARDSRMPGDGPSPFNHFIKAEPAQMLRVSIGVAFRRGRLKDVYAILRGRDVKTGQVDPAVRDAQFARLEAAQDAVLNLTNWHEYLKALQRAGFRGSHMLSSKNNLLYGYVMYLIGKLDYGVEAYRLREAIARWFFMTAVTSRYTGSFETQVDADLARLTGVTTRTGYVAMLDRIVADNLTPDFWTITLVNDLATSSSRSPSLFGYQAALVLQSADALFSKMAVADLLDPQIKAHKSGVERHHIFPRAYLKAAGLKTTEINQIANYAHVEWLDNIHISDEPPSSYWSKYAARFDPDDLAGMMRVHALPDGWHEMDYFDFLEARRQLMAAVTREGFAKLSSAAAPA